MFQLWPVIFSYPMRYRVIQYLIRKLLEVITTRQECLALAALLKFVRMSWKVPTYYININHCIIGSMYWVNLNYIWKNASLLNWKQCNSRIHPQFFHISPKKQEKDDLCRSLHVFWCQIYKAIVLFLEQHLCAQKSGNGNYGWGQITNKTPIESSSLALHILI